MMMFTMAFWDTLIEMAPFCLLLPEGGPDDAHGARALRGGRFYGSMPN